MKLGIGVHTPDSISPYLSINASLIQRGFTQNQPNYNFIFLYAVSRGNGVKMA